MNAAAGAESGPPGRDGSPPVGRRFASCPAIVGPTGVGKTDLIVTLAARYPIEVISLDSRQIYRGLRIGTAQPTAEEQAACRHHLVDFLPPEESYSAQRYRDDFERAFLDVVARGRLPILVGGSGMYLTAVREGFLPLPDDPGGRGLAALRAELDELDDGCIRGLLEGEDPASFARIHPNDRYRSQRALEITRLAGVPMSELMDRQDKRPALGLRYPTFVLERSVAELDARIARRTDAMLAAGWLAEVGEVLARHPAECPGLQILGYRDVVELVRGTISRETMVERVVLSTRQYAKRQRTWFRGIAKAAAGEPEDGRLREAIASAIEAAMGTTGTA
jgi:tRNA dimethylallyltransferase